MKKINFLVLLAGLSIFSANAQDVINAQEAVEQALKKNFGVLISTNNLEIANNNKSILNTRFLPTLGANAGATYNLNNIIANRQDGSSTTINGANSSAYNASLNLNYTLFDGLGRWYNFKQLKEKYELNELEVQLTVENAIYQSLAAYYDVAVQSRNTKVYEEAVLVSFNRLERAQNAFSYGQGNKLAVLNAEVDLNNDSIQLSNAQLNLANAKRNLNAILLEDIERDFEVDTTLIFIAEMEKDKLYKSMLSANTSLLLAKKNIEIAKYNLNINRAKYLPSIAATAQYGWNRNNNNAASFLASSVSYGLTTGATISWNLFDGGSTRTAVQNTKLTNENLALSYLQTENNLKRDFENAWADYLNKIYTYNIQKSNLVSNQDNFNRSNEKFKLGQLNSIDFRQAQQNLLNAETQVAQSKYSAKLAEIKLLQLAGLLMETSF